MVVVPLTRPAHVSVDAEVGIPNTSNETGLFVKANPVEVVADIWNGDITLPSELVLGTEGALRVNVYVWPSSALDKGDRFAPPDEKVGSLKSKERPVVGLPLASKTVIVQSRRSLICMIDEPSDALTHDNVEGEVEGPEPPRPRLGLP